MLSLNFWNVCNDSSVYLSFLHFNIFQNFFGCCFNISGSANYICARPSLHACTYLFSAWVVCGCYLPFLFTAVLYLVRASLHRPVNHGARCFSHLFGLCDVRFTVFVRTPALIASFSRNVSISFDLFSLSSAYFSIVA
jgi:hypothetical protein